MKKSIIIDEFKLLIAKLKNDISLLEDKKAANAINFKVRNFIKVIKNLETFPNDEINNSNELKDLDGFGKGTLTRIDEILNKGILAEAHVEISSEDAMTAKRIDDLMSITGIGPVKAADLNKEGITLEILLKAFSSEDKTEIEKYNLTHHQLIGLKYYKQFKKRIPRNKIDKINTKIQKLLSKYLKIKNKNKTETETDIEAIICGSYRRGATESGDIDVLISGSFNTFDLIDFVKFLTDEEFITDHLTEKGTTKFMGVCDKVGGYRIDIRFIPRESFGAALMYFTGSKSFNTLVRAEALRQGYTLEEYGLYPLIEEAVGVSEEEKTLEPANKKQKDKKKVAHSHQHLKGERVPCPTEETIFDILGIDKKYLDPVNRNLEDNISSL
jgi:DNA polymerase beta